MNPWVSRIWWWTSGRLPCSDAHSEWGAVRVLCVLTWQAGGLRELWASLMAQMVKNLPAMWETILIPGSGRSLGEGNGNPLQYSCLGNSMDRGAWQATVHGVTKSWPWLSNTFTSSLAKLGSIHIYLCWVHFCFMTFIVLFSDWMDLESYFQFFFFLSAADSFTGSVANKTLNPLILPLRTGPGVLRRVAVTRIVF